MPLLSMVGELIQQRKELFNSIAKKDTEIQDYRDQGALTSRSKYQFVCLSSSFGIATGLCFCHLLDLTGKQDKRKGNKKAPSYFSLALTNICSKSSLD